MAADMSPQGRGDSRQEPPDSGGFELSRPVRGVLARLRGRIRQRILWDGLLVAALCVLIVFWFGALIDYVPVKFGSNETPRWLRQILLTAMALGVAWALLWRLGRRWLARLSDRSLALLVERHFPELNNELVTVVELSDKPLVDVSNRPAYRAMLARVHTSVSRRVESLDVRGLLNWRPIWLLAACTAALLALTLGVGLARPGWLSLWSARLFALSDERWPRMARLQPDGVQVQLPTFTGQLSADRLLLPFVDNTVRVPRGGAAVLQVLADTTAPQVPELCTLFYQLADGSRGRANMRRLGGNRDQWQTFMLDGPPLVDMSGDITFDVVGGDARLDDLRLEVVDPAVVTNMHLELAYPDYLLSSHGNLPPREEVEFRSGLRIAEGTQVVLKGKASGPLGKVQYAVRTTQTRGSTQRPPSGSQGEQGANSQTSASPTSSNPASAAVATDVREGNSELEIRSVTPDGDRFEIPLGVLSDTAIVEIRLIDQSGLSSDQIPRYVLSVIEDAQPEVETKLVGIGTAVTPKAVLPIVGTARDDHALARVWTTVILNENPPLELDTPVDADGQLDSRIDLLELSEKQGFEVTTDSTLGLVVSAADQFNLGGIKHVGSGQPFQLAVVTEDKLLVLLDRQELELRQRLELIINELTQLRDLLREAGRTEQSPAAASKAAFRELSVNKVAASLIAVQAPGQPDAAGASDQAADDNDADQARRLALLRAQQSVLQADKSQQELLGVATRVEDIRLQLINNRIDNIDRQTRLHDRVYLPLKAVLDREMEDLRGRLNQMQSASLSPQGNAPQAAAAADAGDRVLVALDAIIANMLDLESYNEIIDLVRGLLDDEERLLEETQKKQKQDILDLLKTGN
jgi:hypothetical protein